jgi:hypothetical protein
MSNKNEIDNSIFKCCAKFLKRFHVNKLLRDSNAVKEKGIPVYDIIAFLIGLVFTGSNLYTLLENNREKTYFGKDAVYRLLSKATINWEMFLFRLSCSVVPEVDKLTSDTRKTALVIDDSPYYRNRSKKVEFLSRCYDHAERIYYKGLTLLTLGWTDGQTFLPIMFRLLGSGNDKNLLERSHVKADNRTMATKRRNDARKDKPSLVLSMLQAVKGSTAQAKYVLFDSWFSSPSLIMAVRKLGYHVVSRLKNNENYRYDYQGKILDLSKIFSANRKRRGRSRYLLSVLVGIRHKDSAETVPAKIVYVRDKANRKKWIALISTDTSLSEDEIIALYGKRWDIEPFHKILKSRLRLEKEFQLRSYDAMTAHATIVMTRYIFLSLENRENIDWRSVNDGFYILCKELDDISFALAFELLLNAMKQSCYDQFHLSKESVEVLVAHFIADLPWFIKGRLGVAVCES